MLDGLELMGEARRLMGGMPASMVADAARGREDVSFMEFEADCAEAVYWANKEAIEAARDGLQVVREVMRREWER